ncbi:hypothetical protein HMI56_004469 [Coelomomyces lativittatus]|nr:hypothetical protein HMI56_004469 [Coelomomyces lativittatus]
MKDSIPKFLGRGNPSLLKTFINKVDTYQRNVPNVPPQVLLDFAASHLEGYAATFYKANQEQYKEGEPKRFKNLDELKEALKK